MFTFKKNTIIGNLEAETDSFLETCFIETYAYRSLLDFENQTDFQKRIIVGRTGSGKSALFRKMKDNPALYDTQNIEAEKTIFEYVRNNIFITDLIKQNVDLRIFFKALWVHVILIKFIEIETGKDNYLDHLFRKHKDLYDYIDSFKGKFFEDEALTTITEKFAENVDAEIKARFSSVGAQTSEEFQRSKQSITNNYVSKELISKQRKIIEDLKNNYNGANRQKKIIISVDDLDKSWLLTQNVKYDFINALLDAIREFLDLNTIKVIVSIRTDILEGVYKNNLRQDEKDKSLILSIEWTKDEIIALLDKRLQYLLEDVYQKRKQPTFNEIFNFNVNNQLASDFIIERTMLRPRDAIDFVNCCFHAAEGKTDIEEPHVLEAEELYFTSRKKALVKEWQSIYPEMQTFIDLIQLLTDKTFGRNCLKKQISSIKEKLINSNNLDDNLVQKVIDDNTSDEIIINELMDIWFVSGLVGIKKSEDLVIYSKYEKEHLDVSDYDKLFSIHPLYWRR